MTGRVIKIGKIHDVTIKLMHLSLYDTFDEGLTVLDQFLEKTSLVVEGYQMLLNSEEINVC